MAAHASAERETVAAKLGLDVCRDEDVVLMHDLQAWLRQAEVDMTLFFRELGELETIDADASLAWLEPAFYDPARRDAGEPALRQWLARYRARLADDPLPAAQRRARMRAANPRYVLRNYLAQQAIERAEGGDLGGVEELQEVLRQPYQDQPGREAFAARRPEWARHKAGCSMLSCSS